MDCYRLFMIGLVILFLGIQLRVVKTFELNEQASKFVQERLEKDSSSTDTRPVGYSDEFWSDLPPVDGEPRLHSITPPRWLGWSFVSVGAILVLTCRCFKK